MVKTAFHFNCALLNVFNLYNIAVNVLHILSIRKQKLAHKTDYMQSQKNQSKTFENQIFLIIFYIYFNFLTQFIICIKSAVTFNQIGLIIF